MRLFLVIMGIAAFSSLLTGRADLLMYGAIICALIFLWCLAFGVKRYKKKKEGAELFKAVIDYGVERYIKPQMEATVAAGKAQKSANEREEARLSEFLRINASNQRIQEVVRQVRQFEIWNLPPQYRYVFGSGYTETDPVFPRGVIGVAEVAGVILMLGLDGKEQLAPEQVFTGLTENEYEKESRAERFQRSWAIICQARGICDQEIPPERTVEYPLMTSESMLSAYSLETINARMVSLRYAAHWWWNEDFVPANELESIFVRLAKGFAPNNSINDSVDWEAEKRRALSGEDQDDLDS